MIGDNPESDIEMANNAGIDTCLTFTGYIKSHEEASSWRQKYPKYASTYIMKSLGQEYDLNN